ncbi:S8 family serine peptidase [Chloroflexus sp.]|uniref:S8 family serine peptidase n=1 Tax=Chloroflexus sp. TaxID=1904827 RepID=UPI00262C604B|nr:S8 family serine peptidase [uncultured Chloroflexus sp.]
MSRQSWSPVSVLLIVCLLIVTVPAILFGAPSGLPIRLRSRQFIPPVGFSARERFLLTAQAASLTDDRIHVLIQFERHPTDRQRNQLAQLGMTLLSYVPDHAWYASIPRAWLDRSALPAEMRSIIAIQPNDKLSPRLLRFLDQRPLPVLVATYADVRLTVVTDAVQSVGGVVEKEVPERNYLLALLPDATALRALTQLDSIFWLDAWPGPFEQKNDGGRQATKTDQVHAAGLHGNPATAPGSIVIGVWDCGWVEANHPGFAGRLTIGDLASTSNGCGGAAGTNDHATHVAGTAAGSGSGSPTGRDLRGHADQATVLSYDVDESAQEVIQAIQTYNLDIAQNSWGPDPGNCDLTVLGVYDETAAAYDALVYGNFSETITRPVQVVFANGNEQSYCPDGWRTASGGAMGKNVIAVGATNSDDKSMTNFSSFGPTEDGRVNPTIVAPGCEAGGEQAIWSTLPGQTYGGDSWCGTSMAAPAVSGILGLMLEAYNGTYNTDPLPATLRAVLIHTAEDLGNPGPDYRFGYGHVDALAAVRLITATASPAQSAYIKVESIVNGETKTYSLTHSGGPLKCTLAWDDVPATISASSTLINNLDLALVAPDSTTYQPWVLDKTSPAAPATTGTNNVDTIEQVVIADAISGTWTVQVSGTSVPQAPQTYALVCPFLPVMATDEATVFIPIITR